MGTRRADAKRAVNRPTRPGRGYKTHLSHFSFPVYLKLVGEPAQPAQNSWCNCRTSMVDLLIHGIARADGQSRKIQSSSKTRATEYLIYPGPPRPTSLKRAPTLRQAGGRASGWLPKRRFSLTWQLPLRLRLFHHTTMSWRLVRCAAARLFSPSAKKTRTRCLAFPQ